MRNDKIKQLIDELEALAREQPGEPQWQRLVDRVREETAMRHRVQKPTSATQVPRPATGPVCCCVCEVAPVIEGEDLCIDCAAMYQAISARVIPGPCDCGHPAKGARAYRYRTDRTEETLCGLECVRTHFRKVFRLFLGATV